MATVAIGSAGNITFPHGGVIARSWSAQITRPFVDLTQFGDWTTRRTQHSADITGTVTGVLDLDTNGGNQTNTPSPLAWAHRASPIATITLQVSNDTNGTNTISFPSLIESVDMTVTPMEPCEVTYNFALAPIDWTAPFAFANVATVTWS